MAALFLPNNGNDNLQLHKLLLKDVSGDLKVYKGPIKGHLDAVGPNFNILL